MLYDRCLSYKGLVPMQINNKGTPVLKAQKMKTRYAFFFLIATCYQCLTANLLEKIYCMADGLFLSHIGIMVHLMWIGIMYPCFVGGHFISHHHAVGVSKGPFLIFIQQASNGPVALFFLKFYVKYYMQVGLHSEGIARLHLQIWSDV